MTEIWKDIKGYEGLYKVSSFGRIKSLKKLCGKYLKEGEILKPDTSNGYERITLYSINKKKRYYVHRLVAMTFIENPKNKPFIDHIDSNPKNNKVENLRWCTQKENINNPHCLKKRSVPHTKEWVENIRKGLQKNPIICVETNTIYNGQMDAQRKTGIWQTNIRKVLCGERKMAGGFTWKYLRDV